MTSILPKHFGRPEENFKWETLCNDLIWNHIAQYLTLSELKNTLLVCKTVFNQIRSSKCFQKSFIVCLSGGLDFSRGSFGSFNNYNLIWKSIEINIDPLLNDMTTYNHLAIQHRFQYIDSIKVFMLNTVLDLDYPLLQTFLSSTTPRSLTLHNALLGQAGFKYILDNPDPDVRESLHKLQELHIVGGRNAEDAELFYEDCSEDVYIANTHKLASISTQLNSFSWLLDYIHMEWPASVKLPSMSPELVQTWAFRSRVFAEMKSSNLHLRHLKIRGHVDDNIIDFLRKQPPLLFLDLEIFYKIPKEIWGTIANLFGHTIEKLRVIRSDCSGIMGVNTHALRQLELEFQYNSHLSQRRKIEAAQILCLTVVQVKMWFKNRRRRLIRSTEDLPAEFNIGIIHKFAHLIELTIISQSGGSLIDDRVFQLIIENLRKLKILRLAHCFNNVTDFGLTGCLPDGLSAGMGINDALIDLRELSMKDCPLITDGALLSAIRFPRLTSLTLVTRERINGDCNPIAEQVLVGIVRQNPRLISIMIHSHESDIEDTLKAANLFLVNVANADHCLVSFG